MGKLHNVTTVPEFRAKQTISEILDEYDTYNRNMLI